MTNGRSRRPVRPTRSWTTVRRCGTRPMPADAGALGDLVAPGARRIDENIGFDRPGAGLDLPCRAACGARARKRGVGPDLAALPRGPRARQASWKAATSMSAQLASNQAPVHCSRSPGISRSSAARSRWTGAILAARDRPASSNASPHGPVRCSAPRGRSKGVVAARPIGVEHRLRRQAQPPLGRVAAKARLPERRRAPGRVPAAQIFGLDEQSRAGRRQAARQGWLRRFRRRRSGRPLRSIAAAGYGLERRAV